MFVFFWFIAFSIRSVAFIPKKAIRIVSDPKGLFRQRYAHTFCVLDVPTVRKFNWRFFCGTTVLWHNSKGTKCENTSSFFWRLVTILRSTFQGYKWGENALKNHKQKQNKTHKTINTKTKTNKHKTLDMQFINYTPENIEKSIKFGMKTLQRGVILDHKLAYLTELAKEPIMPTIKDILDLGYCMKVTEKFCQNLKFILYNRFESNCQKSGRSLWIGTLGKELLFVSPFWLLFNIFMLFWICIFNWPKHRVSQRSRIVWAIVFKAPRRKVCEHLEERESWAGLWRVYCL